MLVSHFPSFPSFPSFSYFFSVSFLSGKILGRFTLDSQAMQFSHKRGHRLDYAQHNFNKRRTGHRGGWAYCACKKGLDSPHLHLTHTIYNFCKTGQRGGWIPMLKKRIGFTLFIFESHASYNFCKNRL